MNIWKITTFVLLALAILLSATWTFFYFIQGQPEIYDFDGFEIEKQTFEELAKAVNQPEFHICNMEENTCMRFWRKV